MHTANTVFAYVGGAYIIVITYGGAAATTRAGDADFARCAGVSVFAGAFKRLIAAIAIRADIIGTRVGIDTFSSLLVVATGADNAGVRRTRVAIIAVEVAT